MSNEKLEQAFELFNRLNIKPVKDQAVTDEYILDREEVLKVKFPASYKAFLKRYGTVVHDDLTIFGLGVPAHLLPSVECAINVTRAIHPDITRTLVPIHLIETGVFACLDCSSTDAALSEPVIVLWNVTQPEESQIWERLAVSFSQYIFQLAFKQFWHKQGFENLAEHVKNYQNTFQYNHATGGKLPRNHDWRPYRFCIQDVLFGSTVVQHHREANCLQVDVFLAANIPEYDPLAGAHALISFLLSEAYKCGGTMEIRFSKRVEGGQVPQELQALAGRYNLKFSQAAQGRILPAEAKAFYAALTDFSPQLQTRINQLEQAGQIKMARACYAVHHGVWSKEQVEMIVLGSQRPDSILAGQAQPHQRHLYLHDLYHARAAVLGGILDRRLAKQERFTEEGTPFDLEDDIRSLTIAFEGDTYAKRYQSSEPLPLPWLYQENRAIQIPADTPFRVLVRARDTADMLMHFSTDIKLAQHIRQQTGKATAILVPHDFTSLPGELNQSLAAQLQEAQVGLIVCPETVLNLDVEAGEKLARSRVLRQ